MRVLMCGGGTGGHINPALAIANEIKRREPDSVIEFVGTTHGLEGKLVPEAGYKLHTVKVQGFRRKLTLKNVKALVYAATSVFEARRIIKKFNPDVVIGTGGYASWPTVKAATELHIPTLIQEQNAFPGVTTKKLSKYVDKVCISFEGSEQYFDQAVRGKLVLTGNPVKPNCFEKAEARRKLGIKDDEIYILSSGGSLGADKVNTFVLDAMNIYRDKKGIRQTHAVGHIGWEKFSAVIKEKKLDECPQFEILEYIYDMQLRQAAADVVISRAGAITTAELALIGRATIFIPSPNVAEDHQYKNAMVLKNADAADVIKESVLDGRILAKTVMDLSADGEKRRRMENNMRAFGKPNATKKIVDLIFELTASGK
ncbi:uDP-N-acetylglucosamine--N-acetylmuramyl-(pentapeptide) pyrophosphoryl-undecaprenol N-acetylglucosamine transferase [Ruminococcus sp. CAG:382]|nr:uDP-N-acetylglucosamine--N-acetylmuramyl-(pentapeptide) pyrophosphoryl-undecaprenol N-acetylglucosamine transferase [Ruminococcus sp. CAG:382]